MGAWQRAHSRRHVTEIYHSRQVAALHTTLSQRFTLADNGVSLKYARVTSKLCQIFMLICAPRKQVVYR